MRPTLFDEVMVTASISLPEVYKSTLRIVGKGSISQGVRFLIERLAPEDLEEMKCARHEMAEKIRKTKTFVKNPSGSFVREALGLPKKRSKVSKKKKRKSIVG